MYACRRLRLLKETFRNCGRLGYDATVQFGRRVEAFGRHILSRCSDWTVTVGCFFETLTTQCGNNEFCVLHVQSNTTIFHLVVR